MKIKLTEDWKSMINGCTAEQLDMLDEDATQRAFERELTARVQRRFPDAEIEVSVSDEHGMFGTQIDGADSLTKRDMEQILSDESDQVFSEGYFWKDKKTNQ